MGCSALIEGCFCYFISSYFPDMFRHRFDFYRNSGTKKPILRTGAHVYARGNTKKCVEPPF